jgi:20S proteasome alpha/beta subunit
MFKSSGPAVLLSEPYHCTGVGAYLGDYLMRSVFKRGMLIKDATLLAIQALAAAKSYDANCGGDTQFIKLSSTGQLSNAIPYNVQDAEWHVKKFEMAARELLFGLGAFTQMTSSLRSNCKHSTRKLRL